MRAMAHALIALVLVAMPHGGEAAGGRIDYVEGAAVLQGDDGQRHAMPLHHVLTPGATLITTAQGRATLGLPGSELWLDGATEIEALELNEQRVVLALRRGSMGLGVRRLPPGGLLVETAMGRIDVGAPGDYRIAAGGGAVRLTVLAGGARFAAAGERVNLLPGESLTVAGRLPTLTVTSNTVTPLLLGPGLYYAPPRVVFVPVLPPHLPRHRPPPTVAGPPHPGGPHPSGHGRPMQEARPPQPASALVAPVLVPPVLVAPVRVPPVVVAPVVVAPVAVAPVVVAPVPPSPRPPHHQAGRPAPVTAPQAGPAPPRPQRPAGAPPCPEGKCR